MLYFVSTPIGNLKDISYRAVEVLSSVDVIYCEDTRHSMPLLNHYGIKKPLQSYRKGNEAETAEKIVEILKEGKEIAVISDAGTPVISDPGEILCKRLKKEGLAYTVIPGANAVLPALILSGLSAKNFTFIGFLPEKNAEVEKLLTSIENLETTLIFYCAPHDLKKTTEKLYKYLGDREACAVKEITKLYETATNFNLKEGFLGDERGEFVLVVEGAKRESNFEDLPINEHIALYLEQGLSKMDAIKKVAKERGVPKSSLYKYTLDNK